MHVYQAHWWSGALLVVFIAGCAWQEEQPSAANQKTTNVAKDRSDADKVRSEGDTAQSVAKPVLEDATLGDEMVSIEAEHPDEIPVGSSYTYRLKVKNNSSDKMLHGVVLKQHLSEGFTIEKSEPEQGGDEKEAEWNLVSLKPGETKTVSITAASDVEGTAQLCLAVDYTPAICITAKFVKPEIQITKQAPQEANLCAPIPVTYTIRNTGSGPAENVVLIDDLDEALTTSDGGKQVREELGTVPAGESREVKALLLAKETGEFGTRATAMYGEEKEVRSNTVSTQFRAAALELAFDGPNTEYIKRPLTYDLTVKNTGDAIAENARLTVELPAGVNVIRMDEAELASQRDSAAEEVAEAVAGTVAASQLDETHLQWRFGDLRPGQEATMRFTAVSQIAANSLKFESLATFLCAGEETEAVATTAVTTTEIIALPALLVFAVDKDDPVQVGKEVTYTIGVLNQGEAIDTNVQVVATLPEGLEFVEATGPTKGTAEEQKVTFEKLKELPAGKQVNWHVRAKANKAGAVRLSVETTSDGFTTPVTSEEPTRLFQAR